MVAYQQKLISHNSGDWKFEIRAPARSGSGEDALPGCRPVSSHGGRGKGAFQGKLASFIKAVFSS